MSGKDEDTDQCEYFDYRVAKNLLDLSWKSLSQIDIVDDEKNKKEDDKIIFHFNGGVVYINLYYKLS